jgi:hypothetical protein
MRCENLQEVIVGTFEEGRSPSLLLALISTLSSYHFTHLTIDFVAMPSPHWPAWDDVDTNLLQMVERCGLKQGPEVVLRTRLEMPGDAVDGRRLLPKYGDIGYVKLRSNCRNQQAS